MLNRRRVAVVVLLLASPSCRREAPLAPPAARSGAAHGATPTDVLSRFTVEQLRTILTTRRNQTVNKSAQDNLWQFSDATLVDTIRIREKSIYGFDRRQDYTEIGNAQILAVADSVAGVFRPAILAEGSTLCNISGPSLGAAFHLCGSESYGAQPVAPFCTAFVVGPDTVATAGHCTEAAWKSNRVIFGYHALREGASTRMPAHVPEAEVYRPVEIVARRQVSTGADYAVWRVDRPIRHEPLHLHLDGSVATDQSVYVLGHPSGLPLKYAGDAAVRAVEAEYFVSNLDTFGGNSGSPVVNANNHQVEGILVRGDTDYKPRDGCMVAFVCPSTTGCRGEDATLIRLLRDVLGPKATPPPPAPPITKSFTSGPRLSGTGATFSSEDVLESDPAPDGYKIGTFTYALSGDRTCNAWSTCRAAIEGDRVVFRFTLQGHNEWPPPGQAQSQGNLVVTYLPR